MDANAWRLSNRDLRANRLRGDQPDCGGFWYYIRPCRATGHGFLIGLCHRDPLLISLTSRWDRKKLLLYAQLAFIAGCLVAWVSPNIAVLMISRVILGASSGVFLVVSFAAAAKIIAPYKIGSAISTLVLGFSLSMILGVPIGIAIADWLNWKAIFLLLGLISAGVAWLITKLLPPIEGEAPVPYFQQFKVLGSNPHDCGRANCTNRGFDRFTFHGGSGFSWDWLYRFDGCSHVYDRAGDPKLFYSTFA